MGLFSKIADLFRYTEENEPEPSINPASGLPMIGGVDTAGNPLASNELTPSWISEPTINPATGLMMVGSVDTAGNSYGCGSIFDHSAHSSLSLNHSMDSSTFNDFSNGFGTHDDIFSSNSGMNDDSFGSGGFGGFD